MPRLLTVTKAAKACADILGVFGEPPIASLTVERERCSTFDHGAGLRRKERRTAVGLGQTCRRGRGAFPPHGRIPNFAGAEAAAARLFEIEPWKSASAIKVNPDSPQRPLRAEALRRGITVFVPTPRLRGGFKKLDPHRIPPDRMQEAAGLSRGDRWSEEVALADMPRLDAIVCGSVAVTRDGRRCGKGEGYSDLEFAILRELGHPPMPVATTVHDLQIVASVPRDPTDQPLSVIATPTRAIRIKRPSAAPTGIDWTRLSAEDLEEMPILVDLRRMTTSNT